MPIKYAKGELKKMSQGTSVKKTPFKKKPKSQVKLSPQTDGDRKTPKKPSIKAQK